MLTRLERILEKLAQRHAPHLAYMLWNQYDDPAARIQNFTRRLANHHIAVVVGDIPQNVPQVAELRNVHIQDWLRGYGQMYSILAQRLFPSYSNIEAYYADDRLPPVVVLNGEAAPVIAVMSGYIAPYIAARQPYEKFVTELELRGMADVILNELEAGDLPRASYDDLKEATVVSLRQMLRASIRHVSLTAFDKPVLQDIPVSAPPTKQKVERKPPKPPEGQLPEQSAFRLKLELLEQDEKPDTPTERMFTVGVPMTHQTGTYRRPPVPRLPDDNSDH